VSVRVAFHQRYGVGTQEDVDFAAQWLAYAIPCRRFAEVLADNCARLEGDVVCYSFIVMDLHHLLLAGLPAHSAVPPIADILRAAATGAKCHVWTAPGWQGESSRRRLGRCSHVFGL
jgi:hypothetical protein